MTLQSKTSVITNVYKSEIKDEWDTKCRVFIQVCIDNDLEKATQMHNEVLVYSDCFNGTTSALVFRCGNEALYYACENGSFDIVKWLCSIKPINPTDNGYWAIIKACSGGHLEIVKWLHTNYSGYDPNECYDWFGCSEAFTRACENGHLDVVQWLSDTFNYTPPTTELIEFFVNKNGHTHITEWLQTKGLLGRRKAPPFDFKMTKALYSLRTPLATGGCS